MRHWWMREVRHAGAAELEGLVRVLVDCVEGGASVSFMQPLSEERAHAFWREVIASAARGERVLWIAQDADGVCGTVQVVWAEAENQPHRADLRKMLVHPRARRRGIAAALLSAAEHSALAHGKTLLVLDTASPEAERVYARGGWTRAGVIPDYTLLPQGGLSDTVVYFRKLGG